MILATWIEYISSKVAEILKKNWLDPFCKKSYFEDSLYPEMLTGDNLFMPFLR